MTLFELLYQKQREEGYSLTAIHFNFHLRGEESERDESFVRGKIKQKGIPCVVYDLPLKKGSALQQRARILRYERLKLACDELGLTHIFLGHHADDQAETILMNQKRGAGIKGMGGMERQRFFRKGIWLCRPLLSSSRAHIAQFAKENEIAFVEDSTNAGDTYQRNWIRHHVLPFLKEKDPLFLDKLLESCIKNQLEQKKIEKEAFKFLTGSPQKKFYSKPDYFTLDPHVRFEVVRSLLQKGGFEQQVTQIHFEEIELLLQKYKNLEKDYGNALLVVHGTNFGVLKDEKKRDSLACWKREIPQAGEFFIEPLEKNLLIHPMKLEHKRLDFNQLKNKHILVLSSKLPFPLLARFPRPGDRFVPYGLKQGTKKLSDFFIDRRVPRFQRRKTLVLESKAGIVCLPGLEIDKKYQVGEGSAECYQIHWKGWYA